MISSPSDTIHLRLPGGAAGAMNNLQIEIHVADTVVIKSLGPIRAGHLDPKHAVAQALGLLTFPHVQTDQALCFVVLCGVTCVGLWRRWHRGLSACSARAFW